MTDEDARESVPEDTGDGADLSQKKGKRAFQNVSRTLSDADLANPAVQKMLLDANELLELENSELRKYREKFHEADKRVAVLEEKSKTDTAAEIVSVVCFAVGAAMFGYAPSLWDSQPSGWFALAFGLALIIGGIAAKRAKR